MTKDTAAPPIDLPSSKKPRLDSSACLTDVINPELLTEESKKSLRQQYESSLPYTHAVLHNAFDPAVLVKVRDEIINNIQATYKETDLFKVFQTGDLGNLPMLDKESTALLPNLMLMQKKLYSDEFRSFVRNITGCGELSDKIDCSCNVYAQGGHLLCHDDVIGKNYILLSLKHKRPKEDPPFSDITSPSLPYNKTLT